MKYRHLGKHGLCVSEICLGSWLTYGAATEATVAQQCIERAYDLGINFFDTANVYAQGKAEELVGKVLGQYSRDSYVLATKVYFPMGQGPNDRGLSRKHILEQCDASLKRLGLDYIDLYQAHRYDPSVPLAETLMAFDHLVQQGKILYYDVSEWSAGQLAHAADLVHLARLSPLVSNQPRYNLLQRQIEKEVLPLCRREGIGIINFSPLAQGLLTGKYKPGSPPPEGSRAADPRQNVFLNQGELDQDQLTRVQKLVPLAQEEGLSLSQLALAWCLRQPELSSVIIGASKPAQIDENVGAVGKQLSAQTLQAIDQLFPAEAP
ncbi:aldo/keto reductase family protein [Leptolyngbya sp. FACHB-261]|uniref:aldo/keto reductase family protein n=1 Tax=Leptolyngbya sp. FACHB-261 TaxID=2692806 RepID=UPI0016897D3C|nr:aldo/keto reductase family protein [Leptolyngbya sp. FACHB-261]MBD2101959.1 aldo/keto reductase family protein [Leptolyngbya sp. FACHB-261]